MNDAAKAISQEDTLRFRVASLADVEALACLINGAFRVEQWSDFTQLVKSP